MFKLKLSESKIIETFLRLKTQIPFIWLVSCDADVNFDQSDIWDINVLRKMIYKLEPWCSKEWWTIRQKGTFKQNDGQSVRQKNRNMDYHNQTEGQTNRIMDNKTDRRSELDWRTTREIDLSLILTTKTKKIPYYEETLICDSYVKQKIHILQCWCNMKTYIKHILLADKSIKLRNWRRNRIRNTIKSIHNIFKSNIQQYVITSVNRKSQRAAQFLHFRQTGMSFNKHSSAFLQATQCAKQKSKKLSRN